MWGGVGQVKKGIGNREAKELICTIHGHEPRGQGNAGGRGVQGGGERKGRKKWENYNSIINKIHLKKKKEMASGQAPITNIHSALRHSTALPGEVLLYSIHTYFPRHP